MNDVLEIEGRATEYNTSEEIGELVKALAKVQGSIKPAKRDTDVEYTLKSGRRMQRTYADLTSVWESCRKELSQNNLAVIQTTKDTNRAVTVLTTLAHESGQWIRGELTLFPGGSDPQSYGSALTYARRYALAAIVGIATGEDDDAEDATRGKTKEKVKTTYLGNAAEKKEKGFYKGKITKATDDKQEKNEIEKVEKLGETEVKDEPEMKVLSEEEADKEQARLLEKENPKAGRNQLNIRWHTLRKKLTELNFFGDDISYREWIKDTYKVESSKDLTDKQMTNGITVMAELYNKYSRKEK